MPGKVSKPESDLYLTPDEFLRFRKYAYYSQLSSGLLYDVCCFGGLRISEAINITPKDINQEASSIIIHTLKKRKDRSDEILFPRNTIDALCDYVKAKHIRADQKVFNITRQAAWWRYKKIMKESGIAKNGSPHALRHCHGIQVMEATGDSMMVKMRLRHTDMKNTARYVHLTRNMQEKIVRSINEIFKR